MSGRSNSGLMLVDNPRQLFQSLCALRDCDFTAMEYKPVLESLTRKGRIHDKTRDTYFYTANIFNLIEKKDNKRYVITPICRKICSVMDNDSKIHIYRKYLRGLLLTNKTKGHIFKKFLDFTQSPKTVPEIRAVFGKFPTKTLLAFCTEAGLTVSYGSFVRSTEIKSDVSLDVFYSSLVRVYYEIQSESSGNAKMIYVPIDLLRDMVCLDLGLDSHDLFNSMLTKVLQSELGVSVYLHGAAPQVEDDYVGFLYDQRRYVFISIRDENKPEVKS